MVITLDETKFTSKKAAHAYLKGTLSFPDWYGNNLDALHDMLCEMSADTTLVISKKIANKDRLGSYGKTLLAVFRDCSEENPHLTVRITP